MNSPKYSRLKIDWVLIHELAIGKAPISEAHTNQLSKCNIKAILSLCSAEEACYPESLEEHFNCKRVVLPDHHSGRLPTLRELNQALDILAGLLNESGAVFVHCVAAMERSPLVCMGWLVKKYKMSPQRALDYMMEIHRGTNPLPGQLALLRDLEVEFKANQ